MGVIWVLNTLGMQSGRDILPALRLADETGTLSEL